MSDDGDVRYAAEDCPNCGRRFPVVYGPHPTWIPCAVTRPAEGDDRGISTEGAVDRAGRDRSLAASLPFPPSGSWWMISELDELDDG